MNILDPIGSIKAEIQSKIGEFLQMKAVLLPYTTSNDPQTRDVANEYMARQVALEGQLPGMLEAANNISPNDLFSATTINLTAFGATMNNHVRDVKAFAGPASAMDQVSNLLPGLGITQNQFMIGMALVGAGIFFGKPIVGIAAAGAGYAYAKGYLGNIG